VTKIVGGVIAVCLFIVTIAGIKIWSHRSRAPQTTPAGDTKIGSTNPTADEAKLAVAAPRAADALPPSAPDLPAGSAALHTAETSGATNSAAVNGTERTAAAASNAVAAPAHAARRPARVPTKPATHRAPPKKIRR
jgi:hypothetical protein